jgi:Zn-finger nucleic acid-binding protein
MKMNCPICEVELTRVIYQGFPVFHCGQCHGYLVSRQRMESISHSYVRPVEELKQETLEHHHDDTGQVLRCPGCRKRMRKQSLKPPASFNLDLCDACRFVWLDGGELARLQLAHRISPQGREAAELQRRYREMTPEQRAQLEQNIAKLPESLPDKDEPGAGPWGEDVWASALKALWPGLHLP